MSPSPGGSSSPGTYRSPSPTHLSRLLYLGHVNIPALLSGLITLYLVLFGGPLVRLVSGAGEVSFGFDTVSITLFGISGEIPILRYLYISSKLSYGVAGLSLIAGSLVRDRELSRGLIGFKLPSLTGLVLTMVYSLILFALGGSVGPGLSLGVAISITVLGSPETLATTLRPVFSPTLGLTLLANLLAIIGRRLAAAEPGQGMSLNRVSHYLPVIFPLAP